MIKKTALFIAIIMFLAFNIINNFRELVLEKLEDYVKDYSEKVYVQTDKPYYTTGDDIWYSAYLVNAISHKRSDKSRVIYIELVNPQDSIISKKQLFTNDVSVAGDFKTEKEWSAGNYLIRGYTNYMKNKHVDYFFQKEIPIWNTQNDSLSIDINSITQNKPTEKSQTELPEINFYPESGYLVEGILTKIGIKVKDKNNRNISIKGVIKDSDDNELSTFETFEFGLGVASIIPEPNKTYYASIIINNEEAKYELPKALPTGFNLNIINNGDEIVLKVTTNDALGLKNSFLLAHQRGNIIFEKLETKSTNSYTLRLKTKILSDGVANFTLFNSSGKPVCERLVYIDNPNDEVLLNVSSNNETPKTRDKVTLTVDLKDKNGQPISGNLSMSITDLDAVEQNSRDENIKTYLLLNSDLRGEIQNPGFFFEKENDPKRRYILDLVMLTHGWRRFIWNDLLYKTKIKNEKFSPEKGIYINGHTTALEGEKKLIPTASRLTFLGSTPPYQEEKQTNSNGTFTYGPYIYYDTIPTLIEARIKDFKSDDALKSNRDVYIHLDDNFNDSPKVSRNILLKANTINTTRIETFLKQAKNIAKLNKEYTESTQLLDEIIIKAQGRLEEDQRNDELDARTLYGFPTSRIDMKDYEDQMYLTVLDLIMRLPGVMVVNGQISIRRQGPPRILLNGMDVELEDIEFMNGFDIEFIDILDGPDATVFSNAGNGVVAIYAKEGSNVRGRNVKRKPGIIDFMAIGFKSAREFYAPDHINGFEETIKRDIRTTLHWEPKIVLSPASTEAKVSFFTSDSRSKYGVKIEGITDSGVPIYHVSTFEVE